MNGRYLIFFDDGYAQYVDFNLVHPIYEASKDVWEDVNVNSRSFIKKYLEKYPERPMVKLHKDQTIRTEFNGKFVKLYLCIGISTFPPLGKWWVTTVMSVDCSLVQMFFDASGRVEWIYRGSTRLNPMFKEEQAASNRLQYRQRMTRKANVSSSILFIHLIAILFLKLRLQSRTSNIPALTMRSRWNSPHLHRDLSLGRALRGLLRRKTISPTGCINFCRLPPAKLQPRRLLYVLV